MHVPMQVWYQPMQTFLPATEVRMLYPISWLYLAALETVQGLLILYLASIVFLQGRFDNLG
jgi:hypothetical protein